VFIITITTKTVMTYHKKEEKERRIEDEAKKWDFIDDPEKLKYREVASNCASAITAPKFDDAGDKEQSPTFKDFFESHLPAYQSLYSAATDETGALKPCGIFFESHPVMDGHRCAECFDTKVYTRCFFSPSTHRSFYFCRNCAESFEKKGYRLLE
jgi:hypothetical protein